MYHLVIAKNMQTLQSVYEIIWLSSLSTYPMQQIIDSSSPSPGRAPIMELRVSFRQSNKMTKMHDPPISNDAKVIHYEFREALVITHEKVDSYCRSFH